MPTRLIEKGGGPILVGTDGSADALTATRWAAALANALDTELLVVHAIPLMERLAGGERVPSDRIRDGRLPDLLEEWSLPATSLGGKVRTMLEDGPPILALPRVAVREGSMAIVLGAQGRSANPHEMIGSTCHALLGNSPVPVFVLPPGLTIAADDIQDLSGQP